MPWKPTKLKFCGIAVRRRTLYVLTLFFAIAAVPVISWALLVHGTNASQNEKFGLMAAAVAITLLAFSGWWTIVRHHSVLYQHEARVVWPGAAVLLALATGLGCQIAQSSLKSGHLSYIAPLALGGFFMIFLLARCFMLGRHPKRGDIVRGDGGSRSRRSSRSPVPGGVPSAEATSENREDSLDGEWAEDEAAPTDSPK